MADVFVRSCVAGDFPGEFGGLGGEISGFASDFAVVSIEAGQQSLQLSDIGFPGIIMVTGVGFFVSLPDFITTKT